MEQNTTAKRERGNSDGNAEHLLDDFESTENAELRNGHDKIWRQVSLSHAKPDGTLNIDRNHHPR